VAAIDPHHVLMHGLFFSGSMFREKIVLDKAHRGRRTRRASVFNPFRQSGSKNRRYPANRNIRSGLVIET